jgi:hypothetical protein
MVPFTGETFRIGKPGTPGTGFPTLEKKQETFQENTFY